MSYLAIRRINEICIDHTVIDVMHMHEVPSSVEPLYKIAGLLCPGRIK